MRLHNLERLAGPHFSLPHETPDDIRDAIEVATTARYAAWAARDGAEAERLSLLIEDLWEDLRLARSNDNAAHRHIVNVDPITVSESGVQEKGRVSETPDRTAARYNGRGGRRTKREKALAQRTAQAGEPRPDAARVVT